MQVRVGIGVAVSDVTQVIAVWKLLWNKHDNDFNTKLLTALLESLTTKTLTSGHLLNITSSDIK